MADKKQNKTNAREAWFSRVLRGKDGAINVPFFLGGVAVAALLVAGLWWALGSPEEDVAVEPIIDVEVGYDGPRHALTGVPVEEEVRPAVIAVMIENPVDVRPQSGVDKAFYVYEAPVEGNITRWMALFGADVEVGEIGPVRSARPYYVDWALGWDALYAHVGGSPEALELIRDRGVYDVDEFFWGSTFWRSRRALAPHNVFTESLRLIDAWEQVVLGEVYYDDRLFADSPTEEERPEEHMVFVDFGHPLYDVEWEYRPETNDYLRTQLGEVSEMRDGFELIASNVAVMFTDIVTIDEVGRKRVTTVGEGDAVVFQNGEMIEATWEKESRGDLERFVDADGNEIEWTPGATWVQVLPIGNMAEIVE